jgi:hypothetical protein
MNAQSLRTSLTYWFDERGWRDVWLNHNIDPQVDVSASYSVVYEASFEPTAADAAKVEIWLTAAARIAIGVDSCDRIAHRLGVRSQRSGFAGGHEPLTVPIDGLLSLLGLIAAGSVRIRPTIAPVIGLVNVKAAVSEDVLQLLNEKGYPVAHWLDVVDAATFSTDPRVVSFAPWS